MKKKKKKKKGKRLVPLIPILKHLGACPEGLAYVRKMRAPTFSVLWERCRQPSFALWLLTSAMRRCGAISSEEWVAIDGAIRAHGVKLMENGPDSASAMAWIRRTFDVSKVECALYEYAKREGLA